MAWLCGLDLALTLTTLGLWAILKCVHTPLLRFTQTHVILLHHSAPFLSLVLHSTHSINSLLPNTQQPAATWPSTRCARSRAASPSPPSRWPSAPSATAGLSGASHTPFPPISNHQPYINLTTTPNNNDRFVRAVLQSFVVAAACYLARARRSNLKFSTPKSALQVGL